MIKLLLCQFKVHTHNSIMEHFTQCSSNCQWRDDTWMWWFCSMQNDFKTQELPLARIKKIMKLDEDVKVLTVLFY